jgi:hypothetical protein
MGSRFGQRVIAILAFGALLLWSAGVHAGNVAHHQVDVTIVVQPYASVSVPGNGTFKLTVPPIVCPVIPPAALPALRNAWGGGCPMLPGWSPWPAVQSARIPFTVRGNGVVRVTVTPDRFMRPSFGRQLGLASKSNGAALGYHAIVHFPTPSPDYRWALAWEGWDDWSLWRTWNGFGWLPAWSFVSHLPGTFGGTSPPLVADLTRRQSKADGVIYAVSRQSWTPSGAYAEPGDYYGTVTITVTAE